MFGAFGVLWILVTDHAVELVAGPIDPDAPSTSTLQSIKGLLFIVLSTLLVLWLAWREHKRALALATSERRLSRLADELGESRAMLARTEQLAHIGSWEYDVVTDRIRWSEGMYTLYEMDPSLPAPDFKEHGKILHPDDFPVLQRAVAATIAEGTGYDMVVRIVRGQGEVRDVFVHGRAVRATPGPDGVLGQVIHVDGSLHDIRDKRRAEKEHETLVTAIEHTAEAIIVTELDGRIACVNPAFEAITGISRGEAIGRHRHRAHPDPADVRLVRETWTDRSQGQSWTGRQLHRKDDGHIYTAELSISPVTDPSGRSPARRLCAARGLRHGRRHGRGHPRANLRVLLHDEERGPRTGLGLATVYGIVRQNGGFIDVQSTVGEGTTMRIHLPRHLGDSTPQGRRELNPTPPHRRGSLLIVEDEALLRALVERLLKGLGYDVLSAASPRAALTLVADHPVRFDLLVTDVIMPEMNGLRLYEQLERQRPGLRCFYVSGYPADVIAKRGLVDDDLHFLQQPFDQDSLAHAVAKALGATTT